MKSIAVIGSSGGGTGALSSVDIVDALKHCFGGIEGSNVNISHVQFIISDKGLDDIDVNSCHAKLYALKNDASLHCATEGPLAKVNQEAEKFDQILATEILNGKIDAIVSISCDPGIEGHGVNKKSIDAAILKGLPIVGTGRMN